MKAEFVRVTLFSNVYERAEELAAVRVERRELHYRVGFCRQKFVETGCTACLSVEIWLLVPIHFQNNLILIFGFIGIFVWTIKGKLG